MFYLLTGIVLLGFELFLFLTTKTNIWPEIFLFSWLTRLGKMPYRDFFDDHGLLTHYLLAPFTADKSLSLLKMFFVFIQAFNLILVLLILKKTKSKLVFAIGGITYVSLTYFISENNFWFELFITFFYLASYFLFIQKDFRHKGVYIGLLIGLASLVKPQAGLIIIPLFLITRQSSLLLTMAAIWSAVAGFFAVNHGLAGLIDNLFGYNLFLSRYYRPSYFSDWKFIFFSVFLIILSATFDLKAKHKNRILLPLTFLIFSLPSLATGYARVRMLPIVAFFAILLAVSVTELKSRSKLVLTMLFGLYCLLVTGKAVQYYFLERNKIPYIEDRQGQAITLYLQKHHPSDKFYILGYVAQPYFLLDKTPSTYYPLRYPLIEEYHPDFELKIIDDLKRNDVPTVIVVKPVADNWKKTLTYVKKNYRLVKDNAHFRIYSRQIL